MTTIAQQITEAQLDKLKKIISISYSGFLNLHRPDIRTLHSLESSKPNYITIHAFNGICSFSKFDTYEVHINIILQELKLFLDGGNDLEKEYELFFVNINKCIEDAERRLQILLTNPRDYAQYRNKTNRFIREEIKGAKNDLKYYKTLL